MFNGRFGVIDEFEVLSEIDNGKDFVRKTLLSKRMPIYSVGACFVIVIL